MRHRSLGLAALLGWPLSAGADIGPKPTMDVAVAFAGREPFDLSPMVLLQCDRSDCADAKPLAPLGPQRFVCDPDQHACHSIAYGYAKYFALEIAFPDGKTVRSSVLPKIEFKGRYRAEVSKTGLTVTNIGK